MSAPVKDRPRWTMSAYHFPRGFVLSLAAHWYDGRHLGIVGFDVTLGLIVVSVHISYRRWPKVTP